MGSYIILIGNYGSGKTEIALNLAVNAASAGKRTKVVDLDKVNDYFRMSDRVALLEEKKIDVVSPTYAGRGVTPVNMSAAVASAFAGDWDLVVFDVGGDAAGAMSLGRYHQDFAALPEGSLEVYDIVNVFRPMEASSFVIAMRVSKPLNLSLNNLAIASTFSLKIASCIIYLKNNFSSR